MYLPGVTLTVCLLKELSITTTFEAMIEFGLADKYDSSLPRFE